MQATRERLRLTCDISKSSALVDKLTGDAPDFWRGTDIQFELGLFYGSTIIDDVSNIQQIRLLVRDKDNIVSGTIVMDKTVSTGFVAPSQANWDNDSAQHALITFTNVETNFSISAATSKEYWLTILATTTDAPGREVVLGTSIITVREAGDGSGTGPAAGDPNYYTAAQSDARFVLKTGDTMTGALTIGVDNAVNNATSNVLTLRHTTSGIAAAGMGVGIDFRLENASGSDISVAGISVSFFSATASSEATELLFSGRTSGPVVNWWKMTGDRVLRAEGAGTITTLTDGLTLSTGGGGLTLGTGGTGNILLNPGAANHWTLFATTGKLQANSAKTLSTSTGALTLATEAGNGNIVLSPHGTGDVLPAVDNTTDLGASATRWATGYFATLNAGAAVLGTLTGVLKASSGTVSAMTGGTNRLTYWVDANTIGSDPNLVWSSNKLGVGIGTPDGTLHVHTGSAGAVTAYFGADDLIVENLGTGGISILVPDVSSGYLMFGNASGNIGAFLEWDNANNKWAFATNKTNAYLSFSVGLNIEKWRMTTGGVWEAQGAQTIQSSTGNLTLATAAGNGNILLSPHGTGNVGIGTTTPNRFDELLNLTLTIETSNSNRASALELIGKDGAAGSYNPTALISFGQNDGGTYRRLARIHLNRPSGGATSDGQLEFSTASGGTLSVQQILDKSGHWLPVSDNAKDVGSSAIRFRDIHAYNFKGPVGTMQQQLSARSYHRGLHFDGTSGTKVTSTLTNQNIGAGDFSVWVRFKVQASNPATAEGLWALSSSSATVVAANSIGLYVESDGTLRVRLYGGTTGDERRASVASFITNFGGQVVDVVLTRTGTTLKIYVNGVDTTYSEATAGTPPAWSGTVTSTYGHVGIFATTELAKSPIYRAAAFNLALSASDITDIIASGLPFKFKSGSHVEKITDTDDRDFATSGHNWTAVGTGASVAHDATNFELDVTTGTTVSVGAQLATSAFGSVAVGKRYRLKYTIRNLSAGTITVQLSGGTPTINASRSNGTFTDEFTATGNNALQFLSNQASQTWSLDDISLVQIGAFVDLDLENADPTITTTVQDRSSNGLDGTATATGVTQTDVLEQWLCRSLYVGAGGITLLGANTITTSTGALTLSTSAGNGNIILSPHGTGDVLPAVDNTTDLGASGTRWATGYFATLNASTAILGSLSGVLKASSGTVSGSATTTDLPEGSNLYFTNARALAALPLTTRGDLLTRDGTTYVRLAIGLSGKFLRSDGIDPSWQNVDWTDITNKPSTFTPSSHSHDAADITSGFFGLARGGTNATSFSTTNGVVIYDGVKLVSLPKITAANTRIDIAATVTGEQARVDVLNFDLTHALSLYADNTQGSLFCYAGDLVIQTDDPDSSIIFFSGTGSIILKLKDAAGTKQLGFFGVTPVARASAYTQTYSTADKTHANFTSADLATTAATQTSPWGFATQAQAENIATQFNALRADVTDLKQLVNSVIDDLQAYGLAQ